jgi:hypothetical protein
VRQHGSDQPGIMHLDARNRVRENKSTPLRMNPFIVRQQSESAFKQPRSFIGLIWRQTEPILGGRASAGVPEFNQILRGETQSLPASH